MKCEHCGRPAMRDWIICKRCWQIFIGDQRVGGLAGLQAALKELEGQA